MNRDINQLTEQIIGAGIEDHRELGPGLLESASQRALAHEFRLRAVPFEEQKLCPVQYKDLLIDDAYRLDFLVSALVVVELKTLMLCSMCTMPKYSPTSASLIVASV